MTTTAEVNEFTGKLPVKIAIASEKEMAVGATLQIRSLKGHCVLTPVISQSDLAEEMFQSQAIRP